MKHKPLIFSSLLAAVAVTGCNLSEAIGEAPKVPIHITSTLTKVSGNSFVESDCIGLYTVNATKHANDGQTSSVLLSYGNHIDNAKFTYTNGQWASDKEYYWKDDKTKADFYCYHPYKSDIQNVESVPFTVPTDQSSKAAFESAEILWGRVALKSPTADAVNITCTHEMSQLLIEIKPGKGFTAETLAQAVSAVTVNNIQCNAVLNLKNGELRADGPKRDIKPYYDGTLYRAFIAPQTTANETLVTIAIDGDKRTMVSTVAFKSNSRKKCTITVNKIHEGINVGIGEWENDGIDYGGTLN